MADTKISADTAVTALAKTDTFPVVQGGANKKATFDDIGVLLTLAGGFCPNKTGHRIQPYGYASANTGSGFLMVANTLYQVPLLITRKLTLTKLGIRISTTATGAMRMGLFNEDANGYPGTLIVEPGSTVNTATNADNELTISQTINPGRYYIGFVANATPTLATTGSTSSAFVPLLGFTTNPTGDPVVALSRAFTYGALGDETSQTYSIIGQATQGPPRVWVGT